MYYVHYYRNEHNTLVYSLQRLPIELIFSGDISFKAPISINLSHYLGLA